MNAPHLLRMPAFRPGLLALVALLVCCGPPSATEQRGSPSPSPTASPSPSPSPTPQGLEGAFVPIAGFTFEPVPQRIVTTQVRVIEESVRGFGQPTQVVVRAAESQGEMPVVVVLASITPNEGSSQRDVFAALLSALSTGGRVSRALGGQAFLVKGKEIESIVAPVAVEPQLLVLLASGSPESPVREVFKALLTSFSKSR
jgi:hypothetical protein